MKVQFEGYYGGNNIKADGLLTLRFKAPQTELANVIKSVLMIDRAFRVALRTGDGKTHNVGICTFNKLTTDRHGESVLSLDTDLDSLQMSLDQIRSLVDASFRVAMVMSK